MWFVESIHGMGNDNCKTGLFCNGLLPPLSIAHFRNFGVGSGSRGGGGTLKQAFDTPHAHPHHPDLVLHLIFVTYQAKLGDGAWVSHC